jgi:hypothetical protein
MKKSFLHKFFLLCLLVSGAVGQLYAQTPTTQTRDQSRPKKSIQYGRKAAMERAMEARKCKELGIPYVPPAESAEVKKPITSNRQKQPNLQSQKSIQDSREAALERAMEARKMKELGLPYVPPAEELIAEKKPLTNKEQEPHDLMDDLKKSEAVSIADSQEKKKQYTDALQKEVDTADRVESKKEKSPVPNNPTAPKSANRDLNITLEAFDRVMKAESYNIGTTTEEAFWKDGWNLEDPYDGFVGIIAYEIDHRNKTMKYVIGNFTSEYLEGLNEAHTAVLKKGVLDAYVEDMIITDYPHTYDTFFGPDFLTKICTLIFKNGLLVERTYF